MDKKHLYDTIAARKFKPADLAPYMGGNGRVDRCLELFRRNTLHVGGTLVDVGGGIGDLGGALRDFFSRRVVIDISEKNLEAAAEKGNEIYSADVDEIGLILSDGVANVVTALDFIEHIMDPENFARECARILVPGGQVFINTPNIQFWRHLEELVFRGNFPHTSGDKEVYHGGHLAFFTYNDLADIFSRAGFHKFEQIKDDEGFTQPPEFWLKTQEIKSQADYIRANMRLGNPNLLFVCEKR